MVFICMPGVTWCDYPWPPIISTSATFITIISIITIITTRTWTWLDKRWKGWWKQCRWASWHLWYLLSLQQHFGIWPLLYLLFFSFFLQLKKVLINGPLMRLLSSYNICIASFSPFLFSKADAYFCNANGLYQWIFAGKNVSFFNKVYLFYVW